MRALRRSSSGPQPFAGCPPLPSPSPSPSPVRREVSAACRHSQGCRRPGGSSDVRIRAYRPQAALVLADANRSSTLRGLPAAAPSPSHRPSAERSRGSQARLGFAVPPPRDQDGLEALQGFRGDAERRDRGVAGRDPRGGRESCARGHQGSRERRWRRPRSFLQRGFGPEGARGASAATA
jgi:hypothetical protein